MPAMTKSRATALAILITTGLSSPALSAEWPAKPVRIIAPFAAGGSADTLGRVVAEQLSGTLGQNFFVENRPGAGGLIGSAMVAAAEPDGYNFVVSGIASHVIAPATNDKAGFDPLKSFTHVAYFGGPPIVLIAHPSLGVKSLKDLVAVARAAKDPMGYVSPGAGTLGNLVAEFWASKESIKLEHIPYKGAAQAVTDLVAGHVKLGSMTWTTALGNIRAGTVVPLAVSATKRIAEFPDVPTLKELGYPDLVAVTWFSLSGPAGLPADITRRMNAETVKALASAKVQARLVQEAMETEPMTAEEFTRFVEREIAKWGPVAKSVIKTGAGTPAQ
jgi:tripartite-type tricarboxylate transporter receptor subunit TctC